MEINNSKSSSGIGAILLSFVAVIGTFILYISEYIKYDSDFQKKIESLADVTGIKNGLFSVFLYIMFALTGLILFFVGFFIYKIICKICSCKIPDGKILLSVGVGYAASFLTSSFLLGHIPFLVIMLIGNLIEVMFVIVLCFSDLKKKAVPFFLLRAVFTGLNLIAFRLM
ncbi:MAG: hypothetical protein VZR00_02905 [Lachnospiraceae bacterium]|jgi:hypothetical protein|nr:hypothetical protein [Lachnospiraceae bacterium]MEE3460826.1 hypothetical protein [Lachnospiraceae bacterium]